MARFTVGVVLLALLASAAAAPGRFLLAPSYDCDGAKMLGSVPDACPMMCQCVARLNRMYAMFTSTCIRQCSSCAAAAQSCSKPGMPLPQACASGSGIREVNTCISEFLAGQQQVTTERAPQQQGQQQMRTQQQQQQQQQQQMPRL